jgi:hypothetical protein
LTCSTKKVLWDDYSVSNDPKLIVGNDHRI